MFKDGSKLNKLFPHICSIRDKDKDNCAERLTGGWWYSQCGTTHLTGQHTNERTQKSHRHIFYYFGGDRVHPAESYDSWMEAQMVLIPATLTSSTTTSTTTTPSSTGAATKGEYYY